MSEDDNRLVLDARARAILDGLPPDDRERLERLMEQAAAGQRRMLETALEDAVRMVPSPLRRRVQKLFLG